MTVNVWPPIVIVPCRVVPCGLAAIEYETAPLPVPVEPPVTVSHDVALLTAVQAHPASVVSVVDPVAAAAPADVLPGVIAYVHGAAA